MSFGSTFCFRLLHSVQEVDVLWRGRRASAELYMVVD